MWSTLALTLAHPLSSVLTISLSHTSTLALTRTVACAYAVESSWRTAPVSWIMREREDAM